jgi:hypothetical protein
MSIRAVCLIGVAAVAAVAAPGAVTNDDVAAFMARIEGPQSPNRQGFDPFTLAELMQKLGVPGVSVAVVKDFQIHWAKG